MRALKGEVVQQIAVDDVLYFQASDKYTCVITREGESLIRMPLAELAGQLDAEVFWQIHRGTIVNMNEVASTRRDLGGRMFVQPEGRQDRAAGEPRVRAPLQADVTCVIAPRGVAPAVLDSLYFPCPRPSASLVNGAPREFAAPLTFAQFLDELALAGKRLAVERNGEIVPRSRFAEARLADGDRIEVVVAVGGG